MKRLMDLKFPLFLLLSCISAVMIENGCAKDQEKPNIIILYADDLGYGDLQSYGHPTSSTPNLNRLASEGLQFTQFYASAPVCSPSRAAILTGRYHIRSGVFPGVFDPLSSGGLPHNETTIAEVLQPLGYRTGIVGKWHLGVGETGRYLPTSQGFQYYYGMPYSHDFCPCIVCFYPNSSCYDDCRTQMSSCPIYNGTTIVEQPANLTSIGKRLSAAAKEFISESASSATPFFLYYAFLHTHHPQFAGEAFRNSSARGTFGDSLAELDWGVGQVLQQLEKSGLTSNTFIFFTSDNGPSLIREVRGGNAGLLKCGKGTTYEGGMRVPGIAHWPGRISPGRTMQLTAQIDLLPTVAKLAGAKLPSNVTLDGVDISPVLFNSSESARESYSYYPENANPKFGMYALRWKQYKAHFYTQGWGKSRVSDRDCVSTAKRTQHIPPLLYDLHQDASEQYNLVNNTIYPDVIAEITKLKAKLEAGMVWAQSQTKKPKDENLEPCCNPGCTPFPQCCHCSSHQDHAQIDHTLNDHTYDGHLHWIPDGSGVDHR